MAVQPLWFEDQECTWYVIARGDNGYPLLVYPEKDRAGAVAAVDDVVRFPEDAVIIPVRPIGSSNVLA